ncbi:LytR/AlgR family response regulator transcription factor [Algoriphagus aquimarinus]|uniref:DNA-binding response regulator, LytR/AlgR family n=1 Tax=Algoriphagus aquimarinus TaxID=237018 RepID=A0A1I1C489_9BACT|nr:LytTR family DNA-binding domain-containing protein [Algoriphagus aquimarinus]SFB55293.1 DNA-binding response regulator, LytR/AlgR family [Algoriphagus aquimarinus]
MNCIVVDDESVSREILTFLCNQEPNLEVVGAFNNAMDAFIFLNKEQVDLIFLDVHMPGFSGFDFLQTLKSSSQIILTTSDKESALKAFDYENIAAFLIKPIDPDRFKKAILKVEKILSISPSETITNSKGTSQFYINIDKRLIKLNSKDVNMIEAKGDYVLIHLEDKEYRVHTTLSKIKAKLPTEFFFQVHRSYIINLSKIIDIQDNTILIQKFVIPISRSRRSELMNKLNLI